MIKVWFFSNILGEVQLHSSSPDEIALVEFAREQMGIEMISRSKESIQIEMKPYKDIFGDNKSEDEDSAGEDSKKKFEYEILDTFAFSSARKRMSIILRYFFWKLIYLEINKQKGFMYR